MERDRETIGMYIHVPFCLTKCPYCDFYSLQGCSAELISSYISSLKKQIDNMPRCTADTVYFGGGTPSRLSPDQVYSVMDHLRTAAEISPHAEITFEVNPADCSREYLSDLRSFGINRISMGIQSTDDRILRCLGRRHSANEALGALSLASELFGNVNADIMLAVPGQDIRSALSTCAAYSERGATHISAYLLKCCPGTPFGDNPPDGIPGDDEAAEIYEAVSRSLKELGYRHYEISNFAKSGCESRHNIRYWDCRDYIGLGPAAHSCYLGTRYSFTDDLHLYTDTLWDKGSIFSHMDVEGQLDMEEYVMECRTRFGSAPDLPETFIDECIEKDLIERSENVIRLTEKGFLVSNSTIFELI